MLSEKGKLPTSHIEWFHSQKVQNQAKQNHVMFKDTKFIPDKIITTNFGMVVSPGGGEYGHGKVCGRFLEWKP